MAAARSLPAAHSEWSGIDIWVNNAARLLVRPLLNRSGTG